MAAELGVERASGRGENQVELRSHVPPRDPWFLAESTVKSAVAGDGAGTILQLALPLLRLVPIARVPVRLG
jgi:hypothetical protein